MYACDEGSAYCNCMYAKLKTNTGPHGVLDSIRPTARRDIKAISRPAESSRHQGNSYGMMSRQGFACNECMQCPC